MITGSPLPDPSASASRLASLTGRGPARSRCIEWPWLVGPGRPVARACLQLRTVACSCCIHYDSAAAQTQADACKTKGPRPSHLAFIVQKETRSSRRKQHDATADARRRTHDKVLEHRPSSALCPHSHPSYPSFTVRVLPAHPPRPRPPFDPPSIPPERTCFRRLELLQSLSTYHPSPLASLLIGPIGSWAGAGAPKAPRAP